MQFLIGQDSFLSGPNATATSYANTNSSWVANEALIQIPVPAAFTLTQLVVAFGGASAGTLPVWTFTVRKNGVDTASTVTMSGATVLATDSAHQVSFAAGDLISFKAVASGTTFTNVPSITLLGDSGPGGGQIILGWGGGSSSSAVTWANPFGGGRSIDTTEFDQSLTMPTAGTFSNLYISTDTAPVGAATETFTLRKNSTNTAVTTSITGTGKTANDVAHSFTVAANDQVNLQITPAGSPVAMANLSWSMVFTPSANRESIYGWSQPAAVMNATTAGYMPAIGNPGASSTGANTIMTSLLGTIASVISKLTINLSGAPGAGKSWAFTLNKTTTLTSASVTVSDPATSGSSSGNAAFTAGDYINLRVVPTGTPTQRAVQGSFVITFPTITQTAIARISNTRTKTQPATARIATKPNKTQSATAHITARVLKTQSATAKIAVKLSKTQSAISRISNNFTKTQSAIARISKNLTKTQSATARIVQSLSKTQTATARIAKIITKTQSAVARIQKTVTATQSAIARISQPGSKTQSAISRISNNFTKTQSATARITTANGVTKTQTATARIASTVTKTQSAIARMAIKITKTQSAVARISQSFTKLQTAIARISNNFTKTQSAVARIQKTVTKSQSAVARIIQNPSKTQTATARIAVKLTKVQSALARIGQTGNKTQSAKARIVALLTKTQPAKARISISSTKTQTATSRIQKILQFTQPAKARIIQTPHYTPYNREVNTTNTSISDSSPTNLVDVAGGDTIGNVSSKTNQAGLD